MTLTKTAPTCPLRGATQTTPLHITMGRAAGIHLLNQQGAPVDIISLHAGQSLVAGQPHA